MGDEAATLYQDCLANRRVSDLVAAVRPWRLPENRRQLITFLPTLTCVALGGTAEKAQASQEAWALLYDAAAAFDQVQDDHVAPPLTPARAINVGVALTFSATELIGKMPVNWQQAVYAYLRETLEGQSEDVIKYRPSVQESLNIAEKKTGASFALGCALGALSAGASEAEVAAMDVYGRALGTIVQIHDDLELVEGLGQTRTQSLERFSNVALAYALERLPPELSAEAFAQIEAFRVTKAPEAARRAFEILVRAGARLFCAIEVARRWQRASQALSEVRLIPGPEQAALQRLVDDKVNAFKAPT